METGIPMIRKKRGWLSWSGVGGGSSVITSRATETSLLSWKPDLGMVGQARKQPPEIDALFHE